MLKILLHSNDLMLLSHWKKTITLFEREILQDTEKLSIYKNTILVLDYASCFKDITKIIAISKKQDIKILVLDNTPNFTKGKNILSLGVSGYGNTLLSSSYFNSALETIKNNMIWVYPEFITLLIKGFDKEQSVPENISKHLTSRELDTALLIKDGLSNNEISEQLDISINTVKSHIKNIYEKLHVNNRLALSLLFKK